jgi:peptidoglycan/xylan/chitin deacetylase (PgdA/CDA1 family)
VRIAAADSPLLQWAVGQRVSLPSSLLVAAAGSADVDQLDLRRLAPPPRDAAEALRLHSAFTDAPPASTRLPFRYQLVPPSLRWRIGRLLGWRLRGRQSEWARFPEWPLDLSADFLADWGSPAIPPVRQPAPVLLTHDVDSPEGLRQLVRDFLPIEETHGARSTSYVVPRGWPLDHGLLREVVSRGHEIGVHGFDHSNRTPFLPAAERRARVAEGKATLEPYGPLGYRAPSLLRTAPLLRDLADHFLYDSSIPTSGGPFPTFNNGCATARPFRIGSIVEIPLSMRRDGTLLFLGYQAEEIGRMWIADAEAIAFARGTIVLLTHCESRFSGNPRMLAAYRQFVEFVAGSSRYRLAKAACVASAVDSR